MLAYLDDKRAEYLEEIAQCEADLAEARKKLEWLEGLIADFEDEAEEDVVVVEPDVHTETVAMYS